MFFNYEERVISHATYYFFKTFIIESTKLEDNKEPIMRFYNHDLPQGILFAVKHFQISPYGSKIGGLTIFENHPEYFAQMQIGPKTVHLLFFPPLDIFLAIEKLR